MSSASSPFEYVKTIVNGLPCYKVSRDEDVFTSAMNAILQKPVFMNEKFIYPGPLPVSLTLDIINKKLRKPRTEYLMLEKNDGDRACLVFARVKGKKVTYMVGRQGTVYMLPAFGSLNHTVFLGTIFDAELIKNENHYSMVIFDCMALAGSSLESRSYLDRLSMSKHFLATNYIPISSDRVSMMVKNVFRMQEIEAFMKHYSILDKQGKVDGIIFAPNIAGIVYARDMNMFKWKAPNKNTIDFLHQNRTLFVYDKGKNSRVAELVDDRPWRDGAILECYYDTASNRWVPIKERTDKSFSNDLRTLTATLKTIQDAISIEMLVNELHGQIL